MCKILTAVTPCQISLSDMIPLLPNKLPFFRQFHIIFGFIEKCQIYSICYFKMMSAETKWVTLTIHNRFVCCCFQLCNGQLRQRRLPRLTRKSKVFKTGLPKWIFDINKSLINQSNCDIYAEFQDFNLLEVLKITQT